MVINMEESKTDGSEHSWGEDPVDEERVAGKDFLVERDAILTAARVKQANALVGVAEALFQIAEELKRSNDINEKYMGDLETGLEDTPVYSPTLPDEPEPLAKNIPEADSIEGKYLNVLSEFLDEEQLKDVAVVVEESEVRIEIPYLRDTALFGAVARRLRELGGEYVSAKADSHFKMPKP